MSFKDLALTRKHFTQKRSGKSGVGTKVAKLDLMQQCDHVATIVLYGNIQEAKEGS